MAKVFFSSSKSVKPKKWLLNCFASVSAYFIRYFTREHSLMVLRNLTDLSRLIVAVIMCREAMLDIWTVFLIELLRREGGT